MSGFTDFAANGLTPQSFKKWVGKAAILAGLLMLVLLFNAFVVTVPKGEVGVIYDKSRGGVLRGQELNQGWNVRIPFVQQVTTYPVAFRTYTLSAITDEGNRQGDDSVRLTTKDNQNLRQNLSVSYSVIKGKAAEVYDNFKGAEIEEIEGSFIRQAIKTAAGLVSTQYDILDLYGAKKPEFQEKVLVQLEKILEPKGFQVVAVNLGEAYLPDSIEANIRAKNQAEIARQKAETDLRTKEVEAKQKVVDAKANAESALIKAKAEAEGNRLVSQSLTPELVKLRSIEKLNPNVKLIVPETSTIMMGDKGIFSAAE